jgi:hypothetical protein
MPAARTPITIGLSAAVGAFVASGVLTIAGQPAIPVDVYAVPATINSVEVKGASKTALAKHLAESGAVGRVTCKRGAVSNEPGRVYCSDGGTAGFLLDPATDAALLEELSAGDVEATEAELEVIDGKVHARGQGTPK